VFSVTFFDGSLKSFSELAKEENLINHHIIGMKLSISSAYLAVRFGFKNSRLHLLALILFGLALICELLIESRSNFVVSLLTLIILFLAEQKGFKRHFFTTIPSLLVGILIFLAFTSKIESIKRRFTFSDMEYQQRTSEMRINYLKIAFKDIKNEPFGRGLSNIKLEISGNKRLVHNQYVTFIIAGGILAFLGVYLWIKDILSSFLKIYRKRVITWNLGEQAFLHSTMLCGLTFAITLLSIEFTGLIFFITTSMCIFASQTLKFYEE